MCYSKHFLLNNNIHLYFTHLFQYQSCCCCCCARHTLLPIYTFQRIDIAAADGTVILFPSWRAHYFLLILTGKLCEEILISFLFELLCSENENHGHWFGYYVELVIKQIFIIHAVSPPNTEFIMFNPIKTFKNLTSLS